MDLAVSLRSTFGKATKTLRKAGVVPAELYGHGLENKHLEVNSKEFRKVFREAGENTVINLVLADGKKHPALVHDVQRDSVTSEYQHIDFYEVRMDEKINAPIPVEFVGESPAVKNLGGILTRVLEAVEVEALPADLPQSFSIDLSLLTELGQSLHVKDLNVPKGVKVLVEAEAVLVTISAPMKEEEVLPAPEVDLSTVKVESEEKKEERAKGKEAEAAAE